MSKVIGILSARISSERTPRKIMLQLAGKSTLYHHIERMKMAETLSGICVATSRWDGNESIINEAEKCGVDWLAGSEHDVVDRHIAVCEKYGADACIRIPCDSPVFDWRMVNRMVEAYVNQPIDYMYVANIPFECSVSPELISLNTLYRSHEQYQGDAVTLPIWEHWKDYKCMAFFADKELVRPEYPLTIDRPSDYVVMSHLYAALYHGEPIELLDAYAWLDQNPDIANFNRPFEFNAINRRFLDAQNAVNS
jgi:spore coat polysaccharide biosynthesis protein SpsF